MNDPRAKLAKSVSDAIVAFFQAPDGHSYVDSAAARQALTSVQAMMIEALPFVKTDQQMLDACQLVAAEILVQVKALRLHYEETGARPWDSSVMSKH